MSKKVAVIAFNPVNGMGLFQYLETFFENQISYKTFAIADTKEIKTNSGISISLDGTVADLKGKENDFDALVFACGDAMLKFGEIADKQFIADTFAVIAKFNEQNKILIGHCAAAGIFEMAGITKGKKVAIHPYGKSNIVAGIATDDVYTIDQNLYTAQCEAHIHELLPKLLEVLK